MGAIQSAVQRYPVDEHDLRKELIEARVQLVNAERHAADLEEGLAHYERMMGEIRKALGADDGEGFVEAALRVVRERDEERATVAQLRRELAQATQRAGALARSMVQR